MWKKKRTRKKKSTDRHALLPPRKVILSKKLFSWGWGNFFFFDTGGWYSQIRVNSRNMSSSNRIRQGCQPSFRLPFIGIWSPYFRILVGSKNWNDDVGIVWNRYFSDFPSIQSFDRSWERKNNILPGAGSNRTYNKFTKINDESEINVRPHRKRDRWITAWWVFSGKRNASEKTITLTASKFHGRPHPDMVN